LKFGPRAAIFILWSLSREKINNYYRNKKKSDPLFKFKLSVRNLIYNSFKRGGSVKSNKTTDILGCSFDDFKTYIENQFNESMSWDNYGTYWEFDHIKQLVYAKTFEDIIELNHYTNFQPLEINLNRMKNFKIL
jgi:spore maturation protein CgeB